MKTRWIAGVALCCLVSLGLVCSNQQTQLEANKAVVMAVVEATNNQDYDRLAELYAPDFVRHCQATPDAATTTRDGFISMLKEYESLFPDGHIRIDLLVAEGDLVGFWGSYLGTNTGPMGDIPATGKAVDSEMGGVHRIENGQIAETWVTWDNMAMLAQMGLYPPSTAPDTAATEN